MNSLEKNNQVPVGVSDTLTNELTCSPASDHIQRLAKLIAKGAAPMPGNVDLQTTAELIQQVNQLRRARLLSYLADVIAKDIFVARQKNN